MKAVVWNKKDSVIIEDVQKPTPKPEEVLVKTEISTVCITDVQMIHSDGFYNVMPPVIVGHEVVGVVEEIGTLVHNIFPGQLVALEPAVPCRECNLCHRGLYHLCRNTRHIGWNIPGGQAEYITIHHLNAHVVPNDLSAEAAVLAEPVGVCMHAVKRARISMGMFVIVVGNGPIGIITALLSKFSGASVLVSGKKENRFSFLRSLNREIITCNIRNNDLKNNVEHLTHGKMADCVIDAAGSAEAIEEAPYLLTERGRLVIFSLPNRSTKFPIELINIRELEVMGAMRCPNTIPQALHLIAKGVIPANRFISSTLKLDQAKLAYELAEKEKDKVIKVALIP